MSEVREVFVNTACCASREQLHAHLKESLGFPDYYGANLSALAEFVGADRIELLPYNTLAAAKYASVHRTFTDRIDPAHAHPIDLSIFQNAVLRK